VRFLHFRKCLVALSHLELLSGVQGMRGSWSSSEPTSTPGWEIIFDMPCFLRRWWKWWSILYSLDIDINKHIYIYMLYYIILYIYILYIILYMYYICIIYVLYMYYICIIYVLYMYYICIIYVLYMYILFKRSIKLRFLQLEWFLFRKNYDGIYGFEAMKLWGPRNSVWLVNGVCEMKWVRSFISQWNVGQTIWNYGKLWVKIY